VFPHRGPGSPNENVVLRLVECLEQCIAEDNFNFFPHADITFIREQAPKFVKRVREELQKKQEQQLAEHADQPHLVQGIDEMLDEEDRDWLPLGKIARRLEPTVKKGTSLAVVLVEVDDFGTTEDGRPITAHPGLNVKGGPQRIGNTVVEGVIWVAIGRQGIRSDWQRELDILHEVGEWNNTYRKAYGKSMQTMAIERDGAALLTQREFNLTHIAAWDEAREIAERRVRDNTPADPAGDSEPKKRNRIIYAKVAEEAAKRYEAEEKEPYQPAFLTDQQRERGMGQTAAGGEINALTPLSKLGFSRRAMSAFRKTWDGPGTLRLTYLGNLLDTTPRELEELDNVGPAAIRDIRSRLHELGLMMLRDVADETMDLPVSALLGIQRDPRDEILLQRLHIETVSDLLATTAESLEQRSCSSAQIRRIREIAAKHAQLLPGDTLKELDLYWSLPISVLGLHPAVEGHIQRLRSPQKTIRTVSGLCNASTYMLRQPAYNFSSDEIEEIQQKLLVHGLGLRDRPVEYLPISILGNLGVRIRRALGDKDIYNLGELLRTPENRLGLRSDDLARLKTRLAEFNLALPQPGITDRSGIMLADAGSLVGVHRGPGGMNEAIVKILYEHLDEIMEATKLSADEVVALGSGARTYKEMKELTEEDVAAFKKWYETEVTKGPDARFDLVPPEAKIPIEKLTSFVIAEPVGRGRALRVVELPVEELYRKDGHVVTAHIGLEEGIIWLAAKAKHGGEWRPELSRMHDDMEEFVITNSENVRAILDEAWEKLQEFDILPGSAMTKRATLERLLMLGWGKVNIAAMKEWRDEASPEAQLFFHIAHREAWTRLIPKLQQDVHDVGRELGIARAKAEVGDPNEPEKNPSDFAAEFGELEQQYHARLHMAYAAQSNAEKAEDIPRPIDAEGRGIALTAHEEIPSSQLAKAVLEATDPVERLQEASAAGDVAMALPIVARSRDWVLNAGDLDAYGHAMLHAEVSLRLLRWNDDDRRFFSYGRGLDIDEVTRFRESVYDEQMQALFRNPEMRRLWLFIDLLHDCAKYRCRSGSAHEVIARHAYESAEAIGPFLDDAGFSDDMQLLGTYIVADHVAATQFFDPDRGFPRCLAGSMVVVLDRLGIEPRVYAKLLMLKGFADLVSVNHTPHPFVSEHHGTDRALSHVKWANMMEQARHDYVRTIRAQSLTDDPHQNFNDGTHLTRLQEVRAMVGDEVAQEGNVHIIPREYLDDFGTYAQAIAGCSDIQVVSLDEARRMFQTLPERDETKKMIYLKKADLDDDTHVHAIRHHFERKVMVLDNYHTLHLAAAVELGRSILSNDDDGIREYWQLLLHRDEELLPVAIQDLKAKGVIELVLPATVTERIDPAKINDLIEQHAAFITHA
jgi:hypothetical protein